jgi:hypothetical protein
MSTDPAPSLASQLLQIGVVHKCRAWHIPLSGASYLRFFVEGFFSSNISIERPVT